MRIRLGTRSSRLARWQSEAVAALLRRHGAECELVAIETRGDDILDRPLAEIGGDGAFTERIERELRDGRIDIAVHSLKDLPIEDPRDLYIGAVLGRQDVRDVLVSRGGRRLDQLPTGAVVGSSSTRRQAQLLSRRPDLVVRPIRGNVETRIRKVETGEFDATLLAAAGVVRLGLADKISQWLDLEAFLPAPGQGAIAVQCRAGDADVRRLLSAIDEPRLRAETDAERAFLRALGGGCSAPVAAYARSAGIRTVMQARVGSLDGSEIVNVHAEGDDALALAQALAGSALAQGAARLIAGSAPPPAASSGPLGGLRVVVTRPIEHSQETCRKLSAAGASPVSIPMICTHPLEDTSRLDAALRCLEEFRWVLVASVTGAELFARRLRDVRPGFAWNDAAPGVAAVGPTTAAALDRAGVPVRLVPSSHSGADAAEEMRGKDPALAGSRVLLPRAREGRDDAAEALRRAGARVEEIPVYRTEPRIPTDDELALLRPGVDAVLFASGSAASAWCRQLQRSPEWASAVRGAVVACIGPAAASAARECGLRVDVEAGTHSAAGLIDALAGYFSNARRVPT
ncbi:MAG TPA: hydroxymethylbilane synthase [Spirochaetia bacterium]|nr:hydroxymethylbilane synthase [Spirochaetia bacterium]